MKQLNIEVTRASNGYARKEGRLTKQSERFVRIMEKEGCTIETHKQSGDMMASLKGKPMGYYFGEDETGYVFNSVKDFATFLKLAESGEFAVSVRKPSSASSDDTPKKGKVAAKGKKPAASDTSDLTTKRRARRVPEDAKPTRGKAVAESSEEEPDIDIDAYVSDDASDCTNIIEVLKLLKKELKRVGVTSENVNGLVDVAADYAKAGKKAEAKRK